MMNVMVLFLDVLAGPPIPWVPPGVSTSPISLSSELEPPIFLWKGRGGCSGVHISEQIQAFQLEPTSLKRGEGLISRLEVVVDGEIGGGGEGGGNGIGGG